MSNVPIVTVDDIIEVCKTTKWHKQLNGMIRTKDKFPDSFTGEEAILCPLGYYTFFRRASVDTLNQISDFNSRFACQDYHLVVCAADNYDDVRYMQGQDNIRDKMLKELVTSETKGISF